MKTFIMNSALYCWSLSISSHLRFAPELSTVPLQNTLHDHLFRRHSVRLLRHQIHLRKRNFGSEVGFVQMRYQHLGWHQHRPSSKRNFPLKSYTSDTTTFLGASFSCNLEMIFFLRAGFSFVYFFMEPSCDFYSM